MPRNIDDVVIPERRKSIRNIPITRKNAAPAPKLDGMKRRATDEETPEEVVPPTPVPPRRFEMPARPGSSRRKIFAIAGVSLLVIAFVVLSLFNGATLSYTPRSVALAFENEVFAANKTANSGLLYSVVKLSGEKGLSVPASGQQQVSRKASGTIVVYNNASTEPQQLIENTRFESPDGKIYRVQHDITIPGKSGTTPGSIEAMVYADQAGEASNTGLVDWTVPGLKGTSRYQTIYARSKTAMAGGFVGMEKGVSEADLTRAKDELQTLLSQELVAKASAEVPADFILFQALSNIVFEEVTQSGAGNANTAELFLKGNLYGVMFKRSDLAKELSKGKAAISEGDKVVLESVGSLEIAFAEEAPSDLLSATEVRFAVSGNTKLLWVTDETALKSELAGRSKSDLSSVLNNYPTISNASATIRPFWKSSFPDEAANITVKKVSQ